MTTNITTANTTIDSPFNTVTVEYAAKAIRDLNDYLMKRLKALSDEIYAEACRRTDEVHFPIFCTPGAEIVRILSKGTSLMWVDITDVTNHDEAQLIVRISSEGSDDRDVYLSTKIFDDEEAQRKFREEIITEITIQH